MRSQYGVRSSGVAVSILDGDGNGKDNFAHVFSDIGRSNEMEVMPAPPFPLSSWYPARTCVLCLFCSMSRETKGLMLFPSLEELPFQAVGSVTHFTSLERLLARLLQRNQEPLWVVLDHGIHLGKDARQREGRVHQDAVKDFEVQEGKASVGSVAAVVNLLAAKDAPKLAVKHGIFAPVCRLAIAVTCHAPFVDNGTAYLRLSKDTVSQDTLVGLDDGCELLVDLA
ncbi:hypothetical protein HDK90DRAFT_32335 [Phyllosticta capitalensis]|uniref:Uncharacterized protein n=1 Tax=Phyllosticta capitalensis TaxID=121624 RepID=A0ABR1Z404_9PEZI